MHINLQMIPYLFWSTCGRLGLSKLLMIRKRRIEFFQPKATI